MRSARFYAALDEATIVRLIETGHDGDPRTTLRDCERCGAPFWVAPLASARRFCTPDCRFRAASARRWRLHHGRRAAA